MATKIKNRVSEYRHQVRVIKEGGIVYKFVKDWKTPSLKISEGSTLVQCTDDWYKAFDSQGKKYCFEFGPKMMENIFVADVVIKLDQITII